MNVIILDACRDNPFGTRVPTEAKGLSQFDVPPGSLLAYATAPGHTAGDGEGVNGLYTENLLREIRVPDAKIEDVFKRVRLSVRRRSEGQQIPWESTSLEDDFYFLPPKQKKALSEEELEKQFEDELTIWENIKASKDPAPLEDYIRRFPGGKFSELAQFRLDRLLTEREKNLPNAGRHGTAAPALQAAANPFSKGTAKVDFSYRIGDRFLFRDIDLQTKLETGRRRWTVTAITDDEVTFNGGKVTTDLLGNLRMNSRGLSFIDRQIFVAEYSLGRKWTTVYEGIGRTGKPNEWAISLKVVNRETLTVPAGTFNAFRIEGNGSSRSGSSFQITYWVAPDKVPSYLVYEQVQTTQQGRIIVANRAELAEYRQSAGARS